MFWSKPTFWTSIVKLAKSNPAKAIALGTAVFGSGTVAGIWLTKFVGGIARGMSGTVEELAEEAKASFQAEIKAQEAAKAAPAPAPSQAQFEAAVAKASQAKAASLVREQRLRLQNQVDASIERGARLEALVEKMASIMLANVPTPEVEAPAEAPAEVETQEEMEHVQA